MLVQWCSPEIAFLHHSSTCLSGKWGNSPSSGGTLRPEPNAPPGGRETELSLPRVPCLTADTSDGLLSPRLSSGRRSFLPSISWHHLQNKLLTLEASSQDPVWRKPRETLKKWVVMSSDRGGVSWGLEPPESQWCAGGSRGCSRAAFRGTGRSARVQVGPGCICPDGRGCLFK